MLDVVRDHSWVSVENCRPVYGVVHRRTGDEEGADN